MNVLGKVLLKLRKNGHKNLLRELEELMFLKTLNPGDIMLISRDHINEHFIHCNCLINT